MVKRRVEPRTQHAVRALQPCRLLQGARSIARFRRLPCPKLDRGPGDFAEALSVHPAPCLRCPRLPCPHRHTATPGRPVIPRPKRSMRCCANLASDWRLRRARRRQHGHLAWHRRPLGRATLCGGHGLRAHGTCLVARASGGRLRSLPAPGSGSDQWPTVPILPKTLLGGSEESLVLPSKSTIVYEFLVIHSNS